MTHDYREDGVSIDWECARKLYNKMKRKEATMAAIQFPLSTNVNPGGTIDILDAESQKVCECPNFEMTQAVYVSLCCAEAAERLCTGAAALSGLGSFETLKVRS